MVKPLPLICRVTAGVGLAVVDEILPEMSTNRMLSGTLFEFQEMVKSPPPVILPEPSVSANVLFSMMGKVVLPEGLLIAPSIDQTSRFVKPKSNIYAPYVTGEAAAEAAKLPPARMDRANRLIFTFFIRFVRSTLGFLLMFF